MKPIYSRLVKIDHQNKYVAFEEFNGVENLNLYIMQMIQEITDDDGDREYEFLETALTMKSYIDDFINKEDARDEVVLKIAQRLLESEMEAQKTLGRFTEIQKGILLISFCDMETHNRDFKVLISKADYNEFIEESTGEIKNGLPTKRRVFKAYVANVKLQEKGYNLVKNSTYDVNATTAKYWYRDFLELEPIINDEDNTQKAYEAIDKHLLGHLKKKYKEDYIHLRNTTIHYMRSEGEFDIDEFADEILGAGYTPVNPDLNMADIIEKVRTFPKRYKFDRKFQKVPKAIKARIKDVIPLGQDIELVLRGYIPNLEQIIRPHELEGKKYIMIQSEDGYKYASGNHNE